MGTTFPKGVLTAGVPSIGTERSGASQDQVRTDDVEDFS